MESLFEVLAFVVESVLVGFAFAVGAALWEKMLQLLMMQSADSEDTAPTPPADQPKPEPPPVQPEPPQPEPTPPKPPKRKRS